MGKMRGISEKNIFTFLPFFRHPLNSCSNGEASWSEIRFCARLRKGKGDFTSLKLHHYISILI